MWSGGECADWKIAARNWRIQKAASVKGINCIPSVYWCILVYSVFHLPSLEVFGSIGRPTRILSSLIFQVVVPTVYRDLALDVGSCL